MSTDPNSPWVETYRGAVKAWEADTYEHFTIAYYYDRLADGTLNLLSEADLGPRFMAERRHALATVSRLRCVSELRAGDLLHLRSGVIETDERGARIGHVFHNSAATGGNTVVATAELYLRCMNLDARRGAMLGSEPRARLERLQVDWKAAPPLAHPEPNGAWRSTMRDTVKPWEIDVLEHMSLSFYVHRFSDAVNQALGALGMTPQYLRRERVGFSTFELQGRFLRELHAGARVECRTALAHLGRTSLRLRSRMYDLDSGEPVAEIDQSGVHLDLDTRRPSPVPEAIRQQASAALRAG